MNPGPFAIQIDLLPFQTRDVRSPKPRREREHTMPLLDAAGSSPEALRLVLGQESDAPRGFLQ